MDRSAAAAAETEIRTAAAPENAAAAARQRLAGDTTPPIHLRPGNSVEDLRIAPLPGPGSGNSTVGWNRLCWRQPTPG